MVNIKLDSEWTLTSDSRQWILQLNNRYMSFHTTLECAIEYFLEIKTRTCNATTIQELINYQKTLHSSLQQVLFPCKFKLTVEQYIEGKTSIEPKKCDKNGK